MSMLELRKFVAPEFIFGSGALDLVGRYARNFGGKKIMIATDPGLLAVGCCNRVEEILAEEGLACAVFSGISPNPRAEEAMRGAEFYAENDCDVIVAVGGGSVMDCAKGIGIVSTNRRNVLEFEGIDKVPIPGPPLICIPTTAGTSADVSQFAIISNRVRHVKIAIISKTMVPDVALIDPATTLTMDSYLTACTGMDALVHAIEAYVSTASSPLLDLHALEAIRLIGTYLPQVMKKPDDLELRGWVMLGSLEAGIAFSNASLGAVHAMAHSLGGLLDLAHGECNAILLGPVMAFNYREVGTRYRKVGEALGLDMEGMAAREAEAAVLAKIRDLKEEVGIRSTLAERGVTIADIPELARNAIKDPCMVTNPRMPNQRDIEVVYEEAL
ncbi:MAG: iron-containing alcohol dehydrogenase [Desulfobulbaceae bacterium]|nr:MAG: iron-containing alcohol dehydrogenase [Desulfobulbaceae bacterium]